MPNPSNIDLAVERIDDEIQLYEDKLAELKTIRKALVSGIKISDADVAKPQRKLSGAAKAAAERKAAESASATSDDDESDEAPRKSRASRRARVRRDNGADVSDSKVSKKDQIIALLEEGHKPSQVARMLDTNPGYVHTVKRTMTEDE